ncbi:MAG: hypothetical protein D6813_02005 [Calditrichaeota bacterium]|nr:MAG: hypothetical protein D6813_02005 [Calditrichota bacterium]
MKFILIVTIPAFTGFTLFKHFKTSLTLGECIFTGIPFGLALFTAASFLFNLLFGFFWYITIIVQLCFLILSLYLLKIKPASPFKVQKIDIYAFSIFIFSIVLFTFLASRLIIWKNGDLATGFVDAWGDLPLHISLVSSFTSDTHLVLRSTILAGEPLAYPFMSDFFSALLVQFSIPLEQSLEWPTILLNSLTLTLLFYLSYRLVKNKKAALLAPMLFILAGGLGFLWFLRDLYFAPQPLWEFLQHLPKRYTNLGEVNIYWVNPVLAHLLPQRSFLFGFPLGLTVIILWWNQFKMNRPKDGWLIGLIIGLLPLFHMHTFLTLVMVGTPLAIITFLKYSPFDKWRNYWLQVGSIALVVALPQIWYIVTSKASTNFFKLHLFWMAESENVIWFYLKNLGLFIPLLIMAFLLRKKLKLTRKAWLFYIPFLFLFINCNLFLFAPYVYDNNKIMIFWFLLSLPFISQLLVFLLESSNWWLKAVLFRTLMIGLIFSGTLNIIHELQSGGWVELTKEEIQLAREIRQRTNSQAIFLSAPIHNNLLTLAGRSVVMGYSGHVFSHGIDYTPYEKAIEDMYRGEEEARNLLLQYKVSYAVVGPHEREKFGENVKWFEDFFPVFLKSTHYKIYQINSAAEKSVYTTQK